MKHCDELGTRQKKYENITRQYLTPRSNILIRCDGRSFHTYCRYLKKPFDDGLMEDMDKTAIALCQKIQGAKLAFVQSDEISIWATSYDNLQSEAWFGGNIQKICSVSASIATAQFNKFRQLRSLEPKIKHLAQELWENGRSKISLDDNLAHFDARVWTIPEPPEVANYFKWRSDDAARNSLQMLARSLYSHKQLEGKNSSELHDLIHAKGQNWNDLPSRYKCGRLIGHKTIHYKLGIDDIGGGVVSNHTSREWSVLDMAAHNFEFWYTQIIHRAPYG